MEMKCLPAIHRVSTRLRKETQTVISNKLLRILTAKTVDDRRGLEVESSLVGLPDFKSGARG
jgi:hypothetical protein